MSNTVCCHSGFRYAERPLSFDYAGQIHQIRDVLAEAKTENGCQFTVLTGTWHQYQLTYNELHDAWQIKPITD